MITSLNIENFKSITKIELKPKKFNLLIGKPNVGKSNMLEAISLLGLPIPLKNYNSLSEIGIRSKKLKDVFQDVTKSIKVSSEKVSFEIKPSSTNNTEFKLHSNDLNYQDKILTHNFSFNNSGQVGYDPHLFNDILEEISVKYYKFEKPYTKSRLEYSNPIELSSPFGKNILEVISSVNSVYDELKENLVEYGYDIFEIEGQEDNLYIYKEINGRKKLLPFYLIADTFKRYMFYYAAIHTNINQTLLFEEPESHSFPPYIHQLAQNIVASSNQYFIATHSPYLYNVMVSECPASDLNVYYMDYKKHKTRIKLLSPKRIKEFQEYGTDIFFNIENSMNESTD